jgi:HlyD family secretion protein
MTPTPPAAVREQAADVAHSNGTQSLTERVRGLRLPDKVDSPRAVQGQSNWLPWTLCLMLAAASTSLAVQVYRAPPGARGSPIMSIGARDSASATASNSNSPGSNNPALNDTPALPSGTLVTQAKGYIIPAHQIQVSPIEVSGRIQELFIEEGKWFEKGQVLAKLEDTKYQEDANEAKFYRIAAEHHLEEARKGNPEEIEQAKSELGEARKYMLQYQGDFERFDKLGPERAGKKEYDQAKYTKEGQEQKVNRLESALRMFQGTRDKRIQTSEAELEQAKAREKKANWLLDNCVIRAPVGGNILTKKAEIGNLVNALSFNVSASLCEMADLTKLEVDLEIQEREIRKIELGQPCKIICDAYPDRTWDGKVIRIMPVALRAKTAVQVRVEVLNIPKENAGKFLRPDMGCVVTFFAK